MKTAYCFLLISFHQVGPCVYFHSPACLIPGGPRVAWCCRGPGRASSPPRPTTPSSPNPSPVRFSTPWGRPTSASWWTFTVSHSALASPRSLSRGPLHSLQPWVWGHRARRCCCCGCLFFLLLLPRSNSYPLVLLHYCSSTRKHIRLSFCVSSRSHPAGGAAAKDSRRRLRCHPELQMGRKSSTDSHVV